MTDRIDNFCYLWDGSQEWGLIEFYERKSRLRLIFAGERATIAEMVAVRKSIPAYAGMSVSEAKSLLSERAEIDLGVFGMSMANQIIECAKELNLEIIAVDASTTSYLPIELQHSSGLIIEDNDLAHRVTRQMLAAGCPIIERIESN